MENANRDGELQELKHQKLKISFETEAITEIVRKAIDDWKEDMHSVDAARYGMYLSKICSALCYPFVAALPFFLISLLAMVSVRAACSWSRVLIGLHTVKVL